MSEGMVILLASTASFLAAMAAIISILVLRRVAAMRKETARLASLQRFADLKSRKEALLRASGLTEECVRTMALDTKRLGTDMSSMFAGIAQLLNEAHKLEGNPHPKTNPEDLEVIRERLLSLGERSLQATRTTERLSRNLTELASDVESLRKELEGSEGKT